MSDTGSQAIDRTSHGRLTLTWATNGWALAEVAGRSEQRQVRSRSELAKLLTAVGLTGIEAESEARQLWRSRPKDAADEASRPYQEMWRATGLPAWAIGLILVAFLGLVAVAIVLGFLPARR